MKFSILAFADSFGLAFVKLRSRSAIVVQLMCFLTLATPSIAKNPTVVVINDRGGSVDERAILIDEYRKRDVFVEIRGGYCLSACTMFLSLPQICISPGTVFGFHGPSSRLYGIALPASTFEKWSRVMAAHYPEPLRTWFIEKGRHRIVGFYEFNGRQLIKMGIRQCLPEHETTTG